MSGHKNFELLKTLLKPFESDLNLPEGQKLEDVQPVVLADGNVTETEQAFTKIAALGLFGFDLSTIWDYPPEGCYDITEFNSPEAFSLWQWFDNCDAEKYGEIDFSRLDKIVASVRYNNAGDGILLGLHGSIKGKIGLADHEQVGAICKALAKNNGLEPKQLLKACAGCISFTELDIEEHLIKFIQSGEN